MKLREGLLTAPPELVPIAPSVGLVRQPGAGRRDPVPRVGVPGLGSAEHYGVSYLLDGCGDPSLPSRGPEHSTVARNRCKEGKEWKQEREEHVANSRFLKPLIYTSIGFSFTTQQHMCRVSRASDGKI